MTRHTIHGGPLLAMTLQTIIHGNLLGRGPGRPCPFLHPAVAVVTSDLSQLHMTLVRKIDMLRNTGKTRPRNLTLPFAVIPNLRLLGALRKRTAAMALETDPGLRKRRKGVRFNPLMAMAAFKTQFFDVNIVIKGDRLGHAGS